MTVLSADIAMNLSKAETCKISLERSKKTQLKEGFSCKKMARKGRVSHSFLFPTPAMLIREKAILEAAFAKKEKGCLT